MVKQSIVRLPAVSEKAAWVIDAGYVTVDRSLVFIGDGSREGNSARRVHAMDDSGLMFSPGWIWLM